MPATATDRLNGITTSVAVKPAVRVATTANITLAGLQTVGGVSLTEGDRVLVKDQSDTAANGIYEASTSDWRRAPDFDGARDIVHGTLVLANLDNGQGLLWQVTTADPITIGSSAITFRAFTDPNRVYPQTAAEALAGLTPVSYSYPVGHVRRWGAALNGTTDDTTAITNAVLSIYTQGGGRVWGLDGATCKTTQPITILDRVILDMEFGTIKPYLSGSSDYGFRVRSYAQILNGTIAVQSSGTPGSQGGYHSPIKIGPFYGEGGTVASPSAEEGVTGWVLRNLILSTTATDKFAIGVLGGANNGIIENITIPDSSVMAAAIGLDWGFIGTITSTVAEQYNNSVRFLANTAYTTHPNNITIRNIRIGNLSRSSSEYSTGIRLSAVHNITVENVNIAGIQYSGIFHTAGDLGYEYAQTSVKPFAHKNVVVRNVNVEDANNGWGYFVDALADNILAAQTTNQTTSGVPYVPILDPYAECGMVLDRCITASDAGASTLPGFRLQNIRGLTVIDGQARGHLWGMLIETACHKVKVIRGRFALNRNDGIYINGTIHPTDAHLEDVFLDQNGQDGGYSNPAGVKLDGADRAKIMRCKFGADGYVTETTQKLGIHVVSTACTLLSIRDCYVNACKATTGIAYGIGASTDYGILDVFSGNRANSGVATLYAGVNIIPTEVGYDTSGNEIRTFRAARAVLTAGTTPTAGTWKTSDTIFYSDPVTADYIGTGCTSGGSPGTWRRFGATT